MLDEDVELLDCVVGAAERRFRLLQAAEAAHRATAPESRAESRFALFGASTVLVAAVLRVQRHWRGHVARIRAARSEAQSGEAQSTSSQLKLSAVENVIEVAVVKETWHGRAAV